MPDALARGRAAFQRQAWAEAFTCLAEADGERPLDPEVLVELALCAGLSGHDDEALSSWTRAYERFLARGDAPAAAYCAIWLGMRLNFLRETVRARAWLARAQAILEAAEADCVECGLVLIPRALGALDAGDFATANALFTQAREIAERFHDRDLLTLARLGIGACQVRSGSPRDGLATLDELMIVVEGREVSAAIVGIVYCAVIEECYQVFDLRRAQEWTSALSVWCDSQPELVPFQGQCQVYRAQVMQLHGAWPDAMALARTVAETNDRAMRPAVGPALYRVGELHRLRGEFDRAEEAYRAASRYGHAPEPGMLQLRLAQHQVESAAATIARALDETADRAARCRLLPATVEIMLAANDLVAAQAAADELGLLASELDAPFLRACADLARGAVRLADGDARAALGLLRSAAAAWHSLEAPYEAARTRELIGRALRSLGDADGAQLELDAAAWSYRLLGAAPDLARLEPGDAPRTTVGLSQRELEVLRLLATGKTNRAIADELVLSEKTVARHVSNIFVKLDLSSRSAATAYAYEHGLV